MTVQEKFRGSSTVRSLISTIFFKRALAIGASCRRTLSSGWSRCSNTRNAGPLHWNTESSGRKCVG